MGVVRIIISVSDLKKCESKFACITSCCHHVETGTMYLVKSSHG